MTQWTRDDLPEMRWLHQTFLDGPSAGVEAGFEDLAVALVDHLNAHHPKPEQAMVPARPVSQEERGELWARIRDELRGEYPSATDYDHRKLDLAASASADAVVEYLNDRGGLGIDTREPLERALRERDSLRCDLDWARGKCDELRALVEGQKANVTEAQRERDEAIERVTRRDGQIDQIARQRDDARAEVETARLERDAAFENYKRIKRERDAAVERAEQAEREREVSMSQRETQRTNARRARRARDEWQARTEESERVNESLRDVIEQQAKSTGSGLVHTHGFENSPEGGCNELTLEDGRIIGSCMLPETLRTTLDELTVRLALVQSGRDHYKTMWEGVEKADFAKRERIEELKRQIAELREPRVDASSDDPPAPAVSRADIEKAVNTGVRGTTDGDLIDPDADLPAGECVRLAVDAVCDLLGIEGEQAVDPIEAKAIELHQVAYGGRIEFGHATLNAQEMFRILARHVLGQEADHA